MTIKRGHIYFTNLNPSVGSEINKTRPVLVLSDDINNNNANTITIVPLTSNTARVRSFEVFIPAGEANLSKDSKAKCGQVRTIDKLRFVNEAGKLSIEYIIEVEVAVAVRSHLIYNGYVLGSI